MKIKEMMTKKVITVRKEDTLDKVVGLLIKNRISGAPVVDEKGKLTGIISEKDLFRTLYPNFQDIVIDVKLWLSSNNHRLKKGVEKKKNVKVEKMMTKKVIAVSPEDSVIKTGSLMLVNKVHRFPVVNKKGEVVGIVARPDIFRRLLQMGVK